MIPTCSNHTIGVPFSFRIRKERILIFISIIAYSLVFNWTYQNLVVPVYKFYGLSYNPLSVTSILFSWTVVLLPATWLPIRLNRPSIFLFYTQYFIIYIPAVFVLHNTSKPTLDQVEIFRIVLAMFLGIAIIQCVYSLPLLKIGRIKFKYFSLIFIILLVSILGYIVIKLAGNFRLANFMEIYRVRYQMREIISSTGSIFGFYAQMWLAGFFLPLCFAIGILSKRWIMILIPLVGYLILYGVGGSKSNLVAPMTMTCVYLWLTKVKKNVVPAFIWGLTILLGLPILFAQLFPKIIKWYVALVNFRTFSIPALLMAQYYKFFTNHPKTHMSHVKGINFIVDYPFEGPYSLIIGNYFYGGPVNSNAGFWAGDGLAGFGLGGIILVSILCAFIFYVLDSLSKSFDTRFIIIAVAPAAMTLANVPLSITLVSGGLGFLILALSLLPRKGIFRAVFRAQ